MTSNSTSTLGEAIHWKPDSSGLYCSKHAQLKMQKTRHKLQRRRIRESVRSELVDIWNF